VGSFFFGLVVCVSFVGVGVKERQFLLQTRSLWDQRQRRAVSSSDSSFVWVWSAAAFEGVCIKGRSPQLWCPSLCGFCCRRRQRRALLLWSQSLRVFCCRRRQRRAALLRHRVFPFLWAVCGVVCVEGESKGGFLRVKGRFPPVSPLFSHASLCSCAKKNKIKKMCANLKVFKIKIYTKNRWECNGIKCVSVSKKF